MAVVSGGARILVVIVIVAVMAMVSPGFGQTSNRGAFQIYKSCGPSGFSSSSIRNPNLVVNNPMWLRGTTEAVTLITLKNTTKSCDLLPNTTHQVTVGNHLQVHMGGAAGEEKPECSFPRHTTFQLSSGLLMVSCLPERNQAEAEMLSGEESSRSAPSIARPQDRALDLSYTQDTILDTTTILGTQGSHEPLEALTTLAPPIRAGSQVPLSSGQTTTGVGLTESSGTEHLKTTVMMMRTASSTISPPLTDDSAMKTTEMQDSTTEYVTETATLEPTDETTLATPGSNSTLQPDIKKENISIQKPAMMSNALQPGDHTSDEPDDQVIYLAGAGAGVLALVLGVVVVVSVAYHRRRQANGREAQDSLFISGAYRGSMHSLNHSGSQGAYLNAHVMYSGAEPEFVESFELEERILNNSISYSSHDIPKCLQKS